MEVIKEALTFDDVLLVPKYSSVLPAETNLDIDLGYNLKLKILLVPWVLLYFCCWRIRVR